MLTKEGLIMSMGREYRSIYYNDNTNTFEDEYCADYDYDISNLMENDQILFYKKMGGNVYTRVDDEDFEIVFPVRDEDRTLCYDIDDNTMCDEYGPIVFNIFNIVYPSVLYLFKKNRKTVNVIGINGCKVELKWPDGKV